MKNNNSIQFIHANGFPPKAYTSLITNLEKNIKLFRINFFLMKSIHTILKIGIFLQKDF